MSITMIWAMASNGVIGKNNDMPWHLPLDFAYFKAETLGKKMLMGRKTWESLGAKPLKGRTSLILTRDQSYVPEGAEVVYSLYSLILPYADKLLVTRIEADIEGDTKFPEVDWSRWNEISSTQGIRNEQNPYHYRFFVYERRE
jgi:dihydrofolate reductase